MGMKNKWEVDIRIKNNASGMKDNASVTKINERKVSEMKNNERESSGTKNNERKRQEWKTMQGRCLGIKNNERELSEMKNYKR